MFFGRFDSIQFSSIRLSKLLNKYKNEPSFEKNELEEYFYFYFRFNKFLKTNGRKSYQKELFQLGA